MEEDRVQSACKLSRRKKKGGTFILFGAIIAVLAYSSYINGNIQLAQGLALVAIIAFLLGILD